MQGKTGFYSHLSYTDCGIIIITMSKSTSRSFYLMQFMNLFNLQVKTKLNETITGSFVQIHSSIFKCFTGRIHIYRVSLKKHIYAQMKILEKLGQVESSSIKQHSTSHIWDWCNAVIIYGIQPYKTMKNLKHGCKNRLWLIPLMDVIGQDETVLLDGPPFPHQSQTGV